MIIKTNKYKLKLPVSLESAQDKSNWRNLFPVINNENTKDAYTGSVVCPEGALSVKDNKIILNNKLCNGCLICLRETPFNVINEKRDE